MELGRSFKVMFWFVVLGSIITSVAVATGVAPRPRIQRVDNAFASVNETTTVVDTDLVVHNPYPVSLTFKQATLNYTVATNGIPVAHGAHRGLHVGQGTTRVDFTTRLANERLSAWWRSHVRRGEHTRLTVDARIDPPVLSRSVHVQPVERRITTNVLGAFNSTENRRLTVDGLLVANPVAVVRSTSATWGQVSQARTPIQTRLQVYNPHPFPVVVTEVGYRIRMNDIRVGRGTTEESVMIAPHETETVTARTSIRTEALMTTRKKASNNPPIEINSTILPYCRVRVL